MFFFNHKKQKAGEPISAEMLAQMAETCDQMSRITAVPPLEFTWLPSGPVFRLAGMLLGVYIAQVNTGGISARSGSTPGSGTVAIQQWNGTAFSSMAGTGATFPVKNWNSTAGAIAAGKWCVVLRIMGAYWVLAAEC